MQNQSDGGNDRTAASQKTGASALTLTPRLAQALGGRLNSSGEKGAAKEHPAVTRVRELMEQVTADVRQGGWERDDAGAKHPMARLVGSVTKASAELTDALKDWPPAPTACADMLNRVERVHRHLGRAMNAISETSHRQLVPGDVTLPIWFELLNAGEELDYLATNLRRRMGDRRGESFPIRV